jgi:predicted RNA-binding Zn ribbon-like protein
MTAALRSIEVDDLCIRFVNTVAWRRGEPVEERLPSARALFDWLKANEVASAGVLTALKAGKYADTEVTGEFLRRGRSLREAIYRILLARMADKSPNAADLARLNAALSGAFPAMRLMQQGGDLSWHLDPAKAELEDLLCPITLSAAALLTGNRAGKIRQCEDDRGCGWLFVDESRAGNRRWCSMGDCGNRAKARRHYERQKQKRRTD